MVKNYNEWLQITRRSSQRYRVPVHAVRQSTVTPDVTQCTRALAYALCVIRGETHYKQACL